jgi:hypothetical protein
MRITRARRRFLSYVAQHHSALMSAGVRKNMNGKSGDSGSIMGSQKGNSG